MATEKSKNTAIKKKPTFTVSGAGIPTRDGWKFTQTWKVPDAATNSSRNDRWERLYIRWYVVVRDRAGSGHKPKTGREYNYINKVFSVGTGAKSHTLTLKATDYYPYTKREIVRVRNFVQPWNKKGWGPRAQNTSGYQYAKPAAPSLSVSVEDTTQAAICHITNQDIGNAARAARSKTRYYIYIQDSKGVTTGNDWIKKKQYYTNEYWSLTNNLEFDSRADPGGVQQRLQYGQWREVTWDVWNLGVNGDSDKRTIRHVFAYPAKATIQKIVLSNTANPFDPTGSISVWLKTNHTDKAPVDSVQLQRLRNSELTKSADAGIASGWTDVDGATDNQNCSGLSDNAADAIPDVGTHTWYRIKSTHDNLTSYSAPVEATALFRKKPVVIPPTAEDDIADIYGIDGISEEGTSLDVKLSWKKDDSTGTEVSWSDDPNAWESTNQPNTYTMPDSIWKNRDDTAWIDGAEKYNVNFSHIHIKGLEEGVPYYVMARRYLEGDEKTTYGKWSPPSMDYWPTTPVSSLAGAELKDVQLYIQQPLIRGKDFSASWTYDSEKEQTGWELHCVRNSPKYSDTIVAFGNDSVPTTVIKANQIKPTDTELNFYLLMTTGGDWVPNTNSPGLGIGYYDTWLPVLSNPAPLKIPAITIAAQPLSITITSQTGLTSFILIIKAQGVSTQRPDGVKVQANGDILYSDKVTPAYKQNAKGQYVGTITFPALDFVDGASYTLETTVVQATGAEETVYTELKSSTSSSPIKVKWKHQAVAPSRASTVAANANSKYVTITPKTQKGIISTDVCDIYRMTPDGAQLIAEGIKFGQKVTDRWAPYSKTVPLYYRLATRTSDGDVEFVDIPYKLSGYSIRFDWDLKKVLEVPYNLVYNDSYSKDFEERSHLDGSHAGFWNAGYSRKTNVTTNMVRLADPDQVRLARELAQYAGAVFVRFPNGCAFMANVDVDGIDTDYQSLTLDVSFTITEVALTSEFKPRGSDIK